MSAGKQLSQSREVEILLFCNQFKKIIWTVKPGNLFLHMEPDKILKYWGAEAPAVYRDCVVVGIWSVPALFHCLFFFFAICQPWLIAKFRRLTVTKWWCNLGKNQKPDQVCTAKLHCDCISLYKPSLLSFGQCLTISQYMFPTQTWIPILVQ